MNKIIKFLTINIVYSSEMEIHKSKVIESVNEWNDLYSNYYGTEILINLKVVDINTRKLNDIKTKDIDVYIFNIDKKNELIKNNVLDNFELEILTNKCIVFFKHQIKNNSIVSNLKNLMHNKINNIENQLLEEFNLFNSLDENSLSLLTYATTKRKVFFYPEWVNNKSVNLLIQWANQNGFFFERSLYKDTITNLSNLKLLKTIEFTEYGNPMLYEIPYKTLDKFDIYINKRII